jgi:hypothetical protein
MKDHIFISREEADMASDNTNYLIEKYGPGPHQFEVAD